MRPIDADPLLEQMKCRKDFVGRQSDPVCLIEDAPTLDVEPVRHGYWILPDVCYEDIECSVCHTDMPLPISFDYRPTYKYCPMCGAKMEEVHSKWNIVIEEENK